MDTLLNDIFHAQPDALLMISGLVFIAIAIVGSIKTYIDPGKTGRIAAGAVGAVLLIAGIVMYKPAPAAASTPSPAPATPPPATKRAPSTAKEEKAAEASISAAPGQAATACFVPGKWPTDLHKTVTAGDPCTSRAGEPGKAVVASPFCTYSSGPLAGTAQQFDHLMYVGFACNSPDKQSKGTVLPPPK